MQKICTKYAHHAQIMQKKLNNAKFIDRNQSQDMHNMQKKYAKNMQKNIQKNMQKYAVYVRVYNMHNYANYAPGTLLMLLPPNLKS